jgi:hypothetical protein
MDTKVLQKGIENNQHENEHENVSKKIKFKNRLNNNQNNNQNNLRNNNTVNTNWGRKQHSTLIANKGLLFTPPVMMIDYSFEKLNCNDLIHFGDIYKNEQNCNNCDNCDNFTNLIEQVKMDIDEIGNLEGVNNPDISVALDEGDNITYIVEKNNHSSGQNHDIFSPLFGINLAQYDDNERTTHLCSTKQYGLDVGIQLGSITQGNHHHRHHHHHHHHNDDHNTNDKDKSDWDCQNLAQIL